MGWVVWEKVKGRWRSRRDVVDDDTEPSPWSSGPGTVDNDELYEATVNHPWAGGDTWAARVDVDVVVAGDQVFGAAAVTDPWRQAEPAGSPFVSAAPVPVPPGMFPSPPLVTPRRETPAAGGGRQVEFCTFVRKGAVCILPRGHGYGRYAGLPTGHSMRHGYGPRKGPLDLPFPSGVTTCSECGGVARLGCAHHCEPVTSARPALRSYGGRERRGG